MARHHHPRHHRRAARLLAYPAMAVAGAYHRLGAVAHGTAEAAAGEFLFHDDPSVSLTRLIRAASPLTITRAGEAAMAEAPIDFWFTMGSTYSYLAVMRLPAVEK